MAKIIAASMKLINDHFMRQCEFDERGNITYVDCNFPVGYIAEGEWAGWLVDTTGDRDKLIVRVAERDRC